jgi:hypothetical protein
LVELIVLIYACGRLALRVFKAVFIEDPYNKPSFEDFLLFPVLVVALLLVCVAYYAVFLHLIIKAGEAIKSEKESRYQNRFKVGDIYNV